MITASLTQSAYRFRNDDGNEVTATWIDALNTPITFLADINNTEAVFRLRIGITETAGGAINNTAYPLEYSLNGGAWTVVGLSGATHFTLGANVVDGTPTTQQITSGTYSADPSEYDEDNSIQNAPSWGGNDNVEYEACLSIEPALVNDGDIIQYRQGSLQAYTQIPSLTVSKPAGQTFTDNIAITHNAALQELASLSTLSNFSLSNVSEIFANKIKSTNTQLTLQEIIEAEYIRSKITSSEINVSQLFNDLVSSGISINVLIQLTESLLIEHTRNISAYSVIEIQQAIQTLQNAGFTVSADLILRYLARVEK